MHETFTGNVICKYRDNIPFSWNSPGGEIHWVNIGLDRFYFLRHFKLIRLLNLRSSQRNQGWSHQDNLYKLDFHGPTLQ